MGKILGAILGYMMGGLLGLLIGLFIGHQLDRRLPDILLVLLKNVAVKHQVQIQQVFFETTFSVMGHLAKADGRVTEAEIQLARQVMQRMQLSDSAAREAMHLFSRGKSPDFDLDGALSELHRLAHGQRNLLQMFVEIQLAAGYADGRLDKVERNILLKICSRLGFSEADLRRLEAMIQAEVHNQQPGRTRGMSPDDAYAILNIAATASDADVKKAYRRLMSQHHPDKLAAKGLPKEMMKLAEEKTHEIRTAYERIREQRGFK